MSTQGAETAYVPQIPVASITLDEGDLRLAKWVKDELDKVSSAIASLEGFYKVNHEPPIRYFVGLVQYADGTDWNPGSGEGLYIYKSTGWTFIA